MDKFEEFWKVKPKRAGSNSKFAARKSFERLVKQGIDPDKIISAAQQWCEQERQNKKYDTEYVPMAQTWLNQKRFQDYDEKTAPQVLYTALPGSAEFIAWKQHWAGKSGAMLRELTQRELENRPFHFDSQWPPGFHHETAN